MSAFTPPHVVVDIDGVIADFNGALVRRLAAADFDTSQIKMASWDYPLFEVPNLTAARYREFMTRTMNDLVFWAGLELLPGAQDGLDMLWEANINVTFMTQRPYIARHTTHEWLQEVVGYSSPDLILARDKGQVVSGLGDISAIVEDRPENLRDVLRTNGTNVDCYLIQRPYNRVHQLTYITEVVDVPEFATKCIASYQKTGGGL